jgi:hypothetical protein
MPAKSETEFLRKFVKEREYRWRERHDGELIDYCGLGINNCTPEGSRAQTEQGLSPND